MVGAGGNSKVVVDICQHLGWTVLGYLDDRATPGAPGYLGYQVLGPVRELQRRPRASVVNSIGSGEARQRVRQQLGDGYSWPNCVHPRSYVAGTARLGVGNVVCAGSVINSDAELGDLNLINTNACVEHDCVVGSYNHVAPGSTLCGGVRLGDLNLVGAGSTAIPLVSIGSRNTIGSMSNIVKNIGSGECWYGNPARYVKSSM